MNTSVSNSASELKELLKHLDRYLLDKAIESAKKFYKAIPEKIDDVMAEHRGSDLKIEHRREAWH